MGIQYQRLIAQIDNLNSKALKNNVKSNKIAKDNNLITIAYKVSISNKKRINEYLESIVADLFLKEKYAKEKIEIFVDDGVFSKTGINNWYIDKPIFLLIKQKANKLDNKTYESGNFSATAEKSQSLIPYLEDNKYCIQDNECSIRYNMCSKGAWNKYSQYISSIGCQYDNNDGQTPEITEKYKHCQTTGSSGILANYTSSKCINNKCTALNPTFRCAKNTKNWENDAKKLGNY